MSNAQQVFLKTMGGPPGKKRRIMKDFTLTEISCVDHPAQEGARAVIMKRKDHDRPPLQEQFAKIEQGINDLQNKLAKDHEMTFEKAVEDIKARDKCSGTAAMSKARTAYPDLFTRYQNSGVAIAKRIEATSEHEIMKAGRAEQNEVDALVDEIAGSQKVSRTEALRQVRRRSPHLFA